MDYIDLNKEFAQGVLGYYLYQFGAFSENCISGEMEQFLGNINADRIILRELKNLPTAWYAKYCECYNRNLNNSNFRKILKEDIKATTEWVIFHRKDKKPAPPEDFQDKASFGILLYENYKQLAQKGEEEKTYGRCREMQPDEMQEYDSFGKACCLLQQLHSGSISDSENLLFTQVAQTMAEALRCNPRLDDFTLTDTATEDNIFALLNNNASDSCSNALDLALDYAVRQEQTEVKELLSSGRKKGIDRFPFLRRLSDLIKSPDAEPIQTLKDYIEYKNDSQYARTLFSPAVVFIALFAFLFLIHIPLPDFVMTVLIFAILGLPTLVLFFYLWSRTESMILSLILWGVCFGIIIFIIYPKIIFLFDAFQKYYYFLLLLIGLLLLLLSYVFHHSTRKTAYTQKLDIRRIKDDFMASVFQLSLAEQYVSLCRTIWPDGNPETDAAMAALLNEISSCQKKLQTAMDGLSPKDMDKWV